MLFLTIKHSLFYFAIIYMVFFPLECEPIERRYHVLVTLTFQAQLPEHSSAQNNWQDIPWPILAPMAKEIDKWVVAEVLWKSYLINQLSVFYFWYWKGRDSQCQELSFLPFHCWSRAWLVTQRTPSSWEDCRPGILGKPPAVLCNIIRRNSHRVCFSWAPLFCFALRWKKDSSVVPNYLILILDFLWILFPWQCRDIN